jgi:hypothetical protein
MTHPLGFDKFTLLTSPLYEVRLHIWWPDTRRGREDIHNHRFSFISAVILGQVDVSLYEIASPGTTMLQFREHRQTGGYRYVELANVAVQQSGASSFSVGSAYYLRSSVLHRVDVSHGRMAATLFVRIRQQTRSTTVLVERGRGAPKSGLRQTFEVPDVQRRLDAFLQILG